MEYNEKKFKALANKLALGIWCTVLGILTIAYALEVVKGAKTATFYIIFELMAWVPVIISIVLMKLRGIHTGV